MATLQSRRDGKPSFAGEIINMKKNHFYSGHTLLEVMISIALLMTVMGAALQLSSGMAAYGRMAMTRDDLVVESKRVIESVRLDVSRTTWALYDLSSSDLQTLPDRSLKADASPLTYTYFPMVIQQVSDSTTALTPSSTGLGLNAGLSAKFPHWTRSLALALPPWLGQKYLLASTLGSQSDRTTCFYSTYSDATRRQQMYDRSYFARSQEMIFLQANLGSWSAVPVENTPIIPFPEGSTTDAWTRTSSVTVGTQTVVARQEHDDLGILRMSEWARPPLCDAALAVGSSDVRDPKSFYYNRPAAPVKLRKVYAVVNQGTILTTNLGSQAARDMVQIRWDSMTNPGASSVAADGTHPVLETPTGQPSRISVAAVREYGYVLLPSSIGIGALARVYTRPSTTRAIASQYPQAGDIISRTSGTGGKEVVVERIISHQVSRVVFDTFRTDETGSLAYNQIRMRLYLVGIGRVNEVCPYMKCDVTFTMKLANSSADNQAIAQALGVAPPVVVGTTVPFVY